MNVRFKTQFKKDYQLMIKRGLDISALDFVLEELSTPHVLSEKYHDHFLKGEFTGYKECHIQADWLLIYGYETLKNDEQRLLLVRTGSHSDLFA